MRASRIIAGLLVLASVGGFGMPAAGAADTTALPLTRWFGGEGGFIESACYGFGWGCPGFLEVGTLGGEVGVQQTHQKLQDVDLVQREWPARTGNYMFMGDVPGAVPATAYLSTSGSEAGPVKQGTVSFAFRMHFAPLQPVVIYRHWGTVPVETPLITLTLGPDGRLLLSAAGSVIGATQPLGTMQWHAVTVTYGSQANSAIRLQVDTQGPVTGRLSLPGPSGDVDIGIVSPTTTPFTIALDDFVDSPIFAAPIHGARINYLMPLGDALANWTKSYPVQACRDAARNWQLVSEDQSITATTTDGKLMSCNLGGSSVTTGQNGVVDLYNTEGIPSRHSPSATYHRDLLAQPEANDAVLGIRLRARGLTSGPPVPFSLGYLQGGAAVEDALTFDGGGTGGSQMKWGPTHYTTPGGGAWSAAALGGLQLRADSGPGLPGLAVQRFLFALRLDYIWVP
jgi:hypothetical protein